MLYKGSVICFSDRSCCRFRLNSILAKRNLATSKLDEIKVKANILKSFLEERVAAEESKEKLARAESEL